MTTETKKIEIYYKQYASNAKSFRVETKWRINISDYVNFIDING